MAANASVMETTGRQTSLRIVAPQQRPRKERREAEEALADMDEMYVECRDLRHHWKAVGCFYVGTEVHRKLVCANCETEATDRWTSKGGRIARVYKYPSGFLAKGKRITPTDVRRHILTRATVFSTEEDLLESLFSGRKQRKRA